MHKYFSFFLFFTLFSSGLLAQNCPTPFSLGNDTTLCGGNSLLLSPDVLVNDPLEVSWSPSTSLVTTPGSQTATVSPTTPTAYTLSVRSITGSQLVNNGNFSQGNTGFSSDYDLWTSSGNLDEGHYRITNNPQNVHGDFASCSDNSSGNGNMLVVNGASAPENIWCQNISVESGATYAFSVAITTVVANNPAELQFRINGQLLGSSFNAPPTNCTWLEFFELWDSGSNTNAELCINNQNTVLAGNDFAIDDISFRLTCLNEASITVTPANPPTAEFTAPATLCSSAAPFDPVGLLTSAATPGGVFLLDGSPINGQIDPAQLAPGPHELLYRVGVTDCQDEQLATFTIEALRSAGVFANGQVNEISSCNQPIGAFSAHVDSGFTGDPNGTFFLSGGSSTAFIDQATGVIDFIEPAQGTFTVSYRFEATSACPADESQLQLTFNPVPELNLGGNVVLDCNQPIATLSNSAAVLTGFTYTWWRDGVFFSAQDLPAITLPGTYELRAGNSLTGCSVSESIQVAAVINDITLDLETANPSCSQTNDLASGRAAIPSIQNGTPPFLYSINGGVFSTDSLFSNLTPGQYTISVEDAGGCTSDTTFTLINPTDFRFNFTVDDTEQIEYGNALPLGVQTNLPSRYLDSIEWFPAGIAPRGSTQIVATADSNLFYLATVTTDEGCTFSDSLRLLPFAPQLIYAPNAFSPNGDGINDNWNVFAHPAVTAINSAFIYDRWGNTVFVSSSLNGNNPELGWDGKRNGKPLPVGTYLWSVEIEVFDGRKERFSGEVILLR